MKRRFAAAAAVVAAGVLLPTTAGAGKQTLSLNLCNPQTQNFTTNINNEYFPLLNGFRWVYTGTEQGTDRGLRIEVLNSTETMTLGNKQVTTREVKETEWFDDNGDGVVDNDGDLVNEEGEEFFIEISTNFFAQTTGSNGGTVCYFGEEVTIFEDDGTLSHGGAWRADDDPDFAPGIFMPRLPAAGQTFQQESAPPDALDEATIVGRSATIKVPAGTFGPSIKVREYNPVEGSTGFKYYAKGVGLVQDGPVRLVSGVFPANS